MRVRVNAAHKKVCMHVVRMVWSADRYVQQGHGTLRYLAGGSWRAGLTGSQDDMQHGTLPQSGVAPFRHHTAGHTYKHSRRHKT